MLGMECAACPAPILPGHIYVAINGGRNVHYECMQGYVQNNARQGVNT